MNTARIQLKDEAAIRQLVLNMQDAHLRSTEEGRR
jgi:hypothetical protein